MSTSRKAVVEQTSHLISLRLDGCIFSCPMRHNHRRVSTVRILDLDLAWEPDIQNVLAVLKVLLAWHLPSSHQLRTL